MEWYNEITPTIKLSCLLFGGLVFALNEFWCVFNMSMFNTHSFTLGSSWLRKYRTVSFQFTRNLHCKTIYIYIYINLWLINPSFQTEELNKELFSWIRTMWYVKNNPVIVIYVYSSFFLSFFLFLFFFFFFFFLVQIVGVCLFVFYLFNLVMKKPASWAGYIFTIKVKSCR